MGRGKAYWFTVGWIWEPMKWMGRVLLWIVFFPAGIWRSFHHGSDRRMNKLERKLSH